MKSAIGSSAAMIVSNVASCSGVGSRSPCSRAYQITPVAPFQCRELDGELFTCDRALVEQRGS